MVSPHNDDFVNDMLEHGLVISNYLYKDPIAEPSGRTFPMPGMVKFIREVTGFIKETILQDSEIDEASKHLYQALIDDLNALESINYPWNQSFILMHKSVHFLSFYNKDKAEHLDTHKSKYLEGATLQALNDLPWSTELTSPYSFVEKLCKLWEAEYVNTSFKHEKERYLVPYTKRIFFPCIEELNLAYFNRTLMLGIDPLGIFTEAEVRYDGCYGLCADFFEHDIAHSFMFQEELMNPDLFITARLLEEHINSAKVINRDDTSSNFRLLKVNEIDFPKEALELLMFEISHEKYRSLEKLTLKEILIIGNGVNTSLRANKGRYDNLDDQYKNVNELQLLLAAYFLHCLNKVRFRDEIADPKKAKKRIKKACKMHGIILWELMSCPEVSVYPVSLLLMSVTKKR